MLVRKCIKFDMAIKKGVALSQTKRFAEAKGIMKRAGLPHSVIERVLYEPHNVRNTD
ncbi:MAG: hypothetical protein ACXWT5_11595 [Methylophilus sp.]